MYRGAQVWRAPSRRLDSQAQVNKKKHRQQYNTTEIIEHDMLEIVPILSVLNASSEDADSNSTFFLIIWLLAGTILFVVTYA